MGTAHPTGAKRCSEYTQILGWLPEIPFVVAGTGGKGKKGSFLKRLLALDFSHGQSFYCLENPHTTEQQPGLSCGVTGVAIAVTVP